jgi:hypothetical protein
MLKAHSLPWLLNSLSGAVRRACPGSRSSNVRPFRLRLRLHHLHLALLPLPLPLLLLPSLRPCRGDSCICRTCASCSVHSYCFPCLLDCEGVLCGAKQRRKVGRRASAFIAVKAPGGAKRDHAFILSRHFPVGWPVKHLRKNGNSHDKCDETSGAHPVITHPPFQLGSPWQTQTIWFP